MSAPPFSEFLGIELVRMDDQGAEGYLDLQPHHLNKRGVAHGGLISALLDCALGAAVVASIPRESWCATISLTTQFIAGARQGRLSAHGQVVRRGRQVAFAEGQITDAQGRVVARAQGAWHLWSVKPGSGPQPTEKASRSLLVRGTRERIAAGKILCVGRNYAAHVQEMGAPQDGEPVVFLKPPGALLTGGGNLPIPVGLGAVHHEVELVAVIGRDGKSIPEPQALEHVLGYAVGLDLTLRDVQARAKQRGEPWDLAKGFDASAPISDVVPRATVGDGSGLAIELTVNDQTRQSGNTSNMLRSVSQLVSFCSQWMTLERGDLIFTGTPEGVGPLVPGDRVVARLENVGELLVTIDSATGEAPRISRGN